MISSARRDVAIQAVLYLILVYLLLILLLRLGRLAARLLSSGEPAPNPVAWLSGADSSAASGREDGDGHRKRVAGEVAELCSKLTISAAKLVMVICMVSLLGTIRNIKAGQARLNTPLQDLALILMALTTTLMGTMTWMVRPNLLALWYVLVMAALSFGIAGASSWDDAVYISSFFMLPRVAFSFSSGHVLLATLMNCVLLACAAYVYLTDIAASGCDAQSAGRRCPITMEIMCFCVTVLGSALSKQAMWAFVGSKVQASALIGESLAMRGLLHLMCDVSVELDSDLTFVDNDPKFLAFLTLAPTREIKRQPFQQFVPISAEPDTFKERVRGDTGSSSQPGTLHTTLRDSWGNHINVEVFFVPFESGDTTKHYFVGFKEYENQPLAELHRFEPRGNRQRSSRQCARSADAAAACAAQKAVLAAAAEGSDDDDDDGDDDDGSTADDDAARLSDGSGSSAGSSLPRGETPHPLAEATSAQAMLISLMLAMKSWSIPRSGVVCCPLHQHVHQLRRLARRLKAMPCGKGFRTFDWGQCDWCHILATSPLAGQDADCPLCSVGTMKPMPSRSHVSL